MSAAKKKIDDEGKVFNSEWCSKYRVVPHNQDVVYQNTIAVMKEYNAKRRYTTRHPSQFDEIFGQARVDKIGHLKKSIENSKVFLPVTRKIQNWLQSWILSYVSLWQEKESLSVTANSSKVGLQCLPNMHVQRRNT